jgi:beta-lactamase class A
MKMRLLLFTLLFCGGELVQAQALTQLPIDRLRTHIQQITKAIDTNWSIYIKSLDTNEEIAIDADAVMDTMSVIKIPLMVEAFRQIEAKVFVTGPLHLKRF